MSGRIKGCLIGGILVYALVILVSLIIATTVRQDYESPATASRNVYGFKEGHFGLLEKASRKTEAAWPHGQEMSDPSRIDGADETFVLDWSTEAKPGTVPGPERWSVMTGSS